MRLPQGAVFRGCSHSLMFSLSHSLDPPVAPTAEPEGPGRPGRLHHASPDWLPKPGCGIATCPNGNCHGWTCTSRIAVLSAAPYRTRLLPWVFGVETCVWERVHGFKGVVNVIGQQGAHSAPRSPAAALTAAPSDPPSQCRMTAVAERCGAPGLLSGTA